jgi:hypothetical protein
MKKDAAQQELTISRKMLKSHDLRAKVATSHANTVE